MRRSSFSVLGVLICLGALRVVANAQAPAAEDPDPDPDPDPRVAMVPVLRIDGATTGESTISIAADIFLAQARYGKHDGDWRLSPTVKAAAKDGLAEIIEGDKGGTRSAQMGLALGYSKLQEIFFGEKEIPASVWQRCMSVPAAQIAFDAKVNAARARLLGRGVQPDEGLERRVRDELSSSERVNLCPEIKTKNQAARNAAELPLWSVSMGGLVGFNQMKYLHPGREPLLFTRADTRRSLVTAEAAGHVLFPSRGLSLEGRLRYSIGSELPSTKARWCTPAGRVERPSSDPPETDAAETCSELPVGDPSRAHILEASAYVGKYADDAKWRAAIGVWSKSTETNGDRSYQVDFEAPFYFIQKADKGYAGLVRVAPVMRYANDGEGETSTTVLISLSLLGDRTLFSGALQ